MVSEKAQIKTYTKDIIISIQDIWEVWWNSYKLELLCDYVVSITFNMGDHFPYLNEEELMDLRKGSFEPKMGDAGEELQANE